MNVKEDSKFEVLPV